MDQFQQIGQEKGDYAADVRDVARVLTAGHPTTVALAHRMTRMQLVLALYGSVAVLTPPPGVDGEDRVFMFVAVIEHGAYWFATDGFLDPGFVAGKLGLAYVDGATVAEFLTRVGIELRAKELAAHGND